MGAYGAWGASSAADYRRPTGAAGRKMAGFSVVRTVQRGNGVARPEASRPLLAALMILTMVLLTVGAALVAPSQAALDARTLASKTEEQSSTAVYGLLRYSEGPTPLLGGSVLIPSFSEEADEDECVVGSLAVGMLVVWLVGLVGGLLTVCGEPRRLRTIYEYTRLERPG
jgi:hypothetical protein